MSPRGRRRKRRVIVLGLGVGATITVIVVLALLKEMVLRYHLGNVRGDLDYFEELLETSNEFAVREALERYVVTLEGSKALVHQCLEQGLRSGLEQWLDQAEKTRSRALMHFTEGVQFEMMAKGGAITTLSTRNLDSDAKLRELLSLLQLLEGSRIQLEEYPPATFIVLDQMNAVRAFHGRDVPTRASLPELMILVELGEGN